VSYEDFTNNNLKYAVKSGGVWTTQIADSSQVNVGYTSLALDALGNPHISYWGNGGGLFYASGGDDVTGVPESGSSRISLTVFPNPVARGEARVLYDVPAGASVDVALFDVSGRRVSTLVSEAAGSRGGTAYWTGRDATDRPLAPGVYWLRLVAGDRIETRRVTVVR
jgi:hypothetical protein